MEELAKEFETNAAAKAVFEALPPSHQREHLKYIDEAKKPETRQRRAQKTVESLLGKEATT